MIDVLTADLPVPVYLWCLLCFFAGIGIAHCVKVAWEKTEWLRRFL